MSSFLLVVFRFPNAVISPESCFVSAFSCLSFLPLCCVVVLSSVAFRFFLVGLTYLLTCSVALRGSRAFGATLTAASSPLFTDTLPLARAGGSPCLAVRRRMSLIRELPDGQVSVKGPIITINLRELPVGYCRDEVLMLQIPVKVKLRARSAAEAPEEGPPEVPEGDGQRTKRLKAHPEQPATEAASLPLARALSPRMASAVVPPPIRDPLETPTLETPTPIPSEQQLDAEQASSSGGADLGPGEAGVPSAGSAVHEAVLPVLGTIEVQDSPAHETAAVGARSSRVATLSDKVVRAHSAASGAPLPLARQSVEAKGGWPHGRV